MRKDARVPGRVVCSAPRARQIAHRRKDIIQPPLILWLYETPASKRLQFLHRVVIISATDRADTAGVASSAIPLDLSTEAFEEPIGIVQNAATARDDPASTRIERVDVGPREGRKANLQLSA